MRPLGPRLSARAAPLVEAARARPRHVILAALVAGLLAAPAPPLALAAAGALAAGAGAPLPFGVRARPGLALLAVAGVLLGAWVAAARLAAQDRSALGPLFGRDVTLRGSVLERPRPVGGGAARASLVRLTSGRGVGERVVVRATRWPVVEVGGEVSASGALLRLRGSDSWLRRRGGHGRLLAESVRPTGRRRGGLAGRLDAARRAAERAVSSGLDPPRAALARGMVLGEDEALTEPVRDDFRVSGLAHLLAASGQNVMLLVVLALGLAAAAGLGLRARLVACLALVALYVPIAGAGPSIQRAGVMGAAAIVAVLASRPASRWYAVLLAAAVTLVIDPRAGADPGWQLSFAAVVAILLFAAPVASALRARRVPRPLAEAAALTLTATLGTAPLLAFHFERVSVVSLPANLLAAPAVAPVMWLGTLAIAVGTFVPAAAGLLNALAQFPLAYLGALAHGAAAVPGASVDLGLSSAVALTAAYAVLIALAAGVMHGGVARRASAAGLAVAAVWAVAAAGAADRLPAPPDPRDVVVSFLDVGQGDATLIQHGGATILVDTGPSGAALMPRLREAGVRRVDLLVVTHDQADHEGNAAHVLDRLPVGSLLDGAAGGTTPLHRAVLAAAARRGVPRVVPDTGQVLRAGALELRILWPHREPAADHAGQDPNLRAIVAHLRVGEFDLLLPADVESDVTAALDLPQVEALKVAHHGSADPGTADLLERLRPRVAVIEVGPGNSYGHPTAQALSALRAVPAVLRTDRDGTVRLIVHDGRMSVTRGS